MSEFEVSGRFRNAMVGIRRCEHRYLDNQDGADFATSGTDHSISLERIGRSAVHVVGASDHCKLAARAAAELFFAWLVEHGLIREWQVDDVWFLAETDFALALDIELPPRRVFLGALKQLPNVRVTQNRRVRNRAGRVIRKTTFYDFKCVSGTIGSSRVF